MSRTRAAGARADPPPPRLSDTGRAALARIEKLFRARFSGRVTIEISDGGVRWLSTETVDQGSELARDP